MSKVHDDEPWLEDLVHETLERSVLEVNLRDALAAFVRIVDEGSPDYNASLVAASRRAKELLQGGKMMQGPKCKTQQCEKHMWPAENGKCVFCLVEELKRDRDFWKRLTQKTTSLDALKADMMEDMLKQAVDLVDAMEQGPLPEAEELQEAEEFVRLYKRTWGKK